ncbi:MAG: M67 family peptidase [Synechococcaceae bacterium WBB_3_034]|nr:M67 family peptidase [Synechococcaceae bacterium WBB_3_034]
MVLERTLVAASPAEGCALLIGSRRGEAVWLRWIWPCCNRWEPAAERPRHFQLDPREQLLAQRWGRERGLQVLGAAHSHPSSPAVPSRSDRERCLGPTLMLIRSGLTAEAEPLRAWWLPEPAPHGEAPEARALPLEVLAGDLGE